MSRGSPWLAPERTWAFAALAAVVAGLVQMTRMALHGRFSTDEFTYAHGAWLIARGEEPYRDFFFHHFPGALQLEALVLGSGAEPRDILLTRWLMLLVWPVACVGVWSLARRTASLAGPLAAVGLLGLPPFLVYGNELRPDSVAMPLFVASLALAMLPGRRAALRGLIAGLCWTAAVWASEKVLLYGSVLPLAAVADLALGRPREGGPALVLAPRHFVGGALLGAVVVAGYLTATGNWAHWIHWCLEWNLVHESEYPKRSPWRSFAATRDNAAQLLALAALGWALALASLRRRGAWHAHPDLVLCAAAVTTVASYFIQQAPYQWSLLGPAPFVAIFAGRAAAAALGWLAARAWPTPLQLALGLAVIALVGAPMAYASGDLRQRGLRNDGQLRMLDELARMTAADDPVYDNTGRYVARPHVHYTYFTDVTVRQTRQEWLAEEMPRAIEQAGAVAYLHEGRSGGLPVSLRHYLRDHFLPTAHDIWLWGHAYEKLSRDRDASFLATRAGDYYVDPPQAAQGGQLRVDGRTLEGAKIGLSRGRHVVRWRGSDPSPRFALVWLPRDGKARRVDWRARRKLR